MKQNNKFSFIKALENDFTKEMKSDTLKYQNQYGFDIGDNNIAWNNEADAFRHAFMQAIFSSRYNNFLAKIAGNIHELQGKYRGQDPREENMDLWNNRQGRQIYNEIRREFKNFGDLSEQQQKDIIAQKVVQRMKEGQLITQLDDSRKFNENKQFNLPFTPTRSIGGVQHNGLPLGFAANINDSQSELSNYKNPLTGNNRIFTREEINAMTPGEFTEHEKEIMAQVKAMNGKMPTNNDLRREAITGGGVVYVNSYTRSDGTVVKGYYRSRQRI